MRKLATIRTITGMLPIVGADNISLAIIDGWKAVVKTEEFMKGDRVVFIEADAWVPARYAQILLNGKRPQEYKGIRGIRIQTKRIKGVISEGFVLPMYMIPEDQQSMEPGTDVTKTLGIIKYEDEDIPEVTTKSTGASTNLFPSFIPKTDQERIQNILKPLSDLMDAYPDEGLTFEITEKLDGTSCTVYKNEEGELVVCSRKTIIPRGDNLYWNAILDSGLETKLKKPGVIDSIKNIILGKGKGDYSGLAFQGEIIGTKIQGNRYELKRPTFFVFDIFDFYREKYLQPSQTREICSELGLRHVPVISEGFVLKKSSIRSNWVQIEELKEYAQGNTQLTVADRTIPMEGVVFKLDNSFSQPQLPYPDRFSFKIISNDYLLA